MPFFNDQVLGYTLESDWKMGRQANSPVEVQKEESYEVYLFSFGNDAYRRGELFKIGRRANRSTRSNPLFSPDWKQYLGNRYPK